LVPASRAFFQWSQEVSVGAPAGQVNDTDPHSGVTTAYDYARWDSPAVSVGFAATDIITSWTADTPPGTWLQLDLRGVTAGGACTKWFVMGRWTAHEVPARSSVPGQGDAHGDVLVDRFLAAQGQGLTRIQVGVTLHRPVGSESTPTLCSITAVATRPSDGAPAIEGGDALGVILAVPSFSQHEHSSEPAQWDGSGKAWCGPTCTAMVLAFWGSGPAAADCAWVDPACVNPRVHHVVRGVYDYDYRGTGNWAFNTAYAGQFGMAGFVTKLRSLAEAEAFIARGVPLVLSLSFHERQITGLAYSTRGHLLVLAGFAANGDPVLNDPAAPSSSLVRKTVNRFELETAWLTSSDGVACVIYPACWALPVLPGTGS
jgi:hypothetical protein